MRAAIASLVSVALTACPSGSQQSGQRAASTVAPPAPSPHHDPELVRTLAVLATRRAPDPAVVAATVARLDREQLTLASYIDSLIATDDFASDVAPLVILRQLLSQNALAAPAGYVLNRTPDAEPIYFLHTACAAKVAVRAHPWWDIESEVRVCPDSYKPAQWTTARPPGEPEMSCLSAYAPYQVGAGTCGCGPNLVRCFKSLDHQAEVASSMRDELRGTIAYITRTTQATEQIFLANETFRDRNAEFIHRSHLIELHRDPHPEAMLRELAAWPAGGKWAPREDLAPGQNAGILTAPHVLFFLPDRRQRMTTIYDALWCVEPDSVGATPESLLSIAGANLQLKSAGWQELAARPICTNCHARLDYGLQFFFGYPNANLQAHFNPDVQQHGGGPFYAGNIGDARGSGDLNPQGFARLAVAQPEFRRCIARDFAEYVLGNWVTTAQIDQVAAAIKPGATPVRALMRAALLALVEAWPTRPAAAPEANVPARAPASEIALDGELRKRVADHCLDCHDKEPSRLDLSVAKLDRTTVVKVLDNVAFGRMPKDAPLPEAERAAFLSGLIEAVWTGPDAATARTYYLGRMAALPAHRPEVVFDLIHHSAGAKQPAAWRMMEKGVRSNIQQVTTGLATISGLAAIEACRQQSSDRAKLDACISEALRLTTLTSRPPPPGR